MTEAAVPVADRLRRFRDRHFDCFVDLAEVAQLASGDDPDWFDVLESEIANIRSALEWGLTTDRTETAAFAASLLWYWRKSHRYAEGRRVLDRALRQPDLPGSDRMDALHAAGALAWDQSDRAVARARHEEAWRLAIAAGDQRRQARSAMWAGWACFQIPLFEEALEAFGAALALPESLTLAERANALRGLAWTKHFLHGDSEAALELHREARALLEDAGDSDLTAHYLVESNFLVETGRPDEAHALAERAVALARAGGGDLIFALIAREKAAQALGDVELLRRAVDEGIEFTQAAGQLWVDHPQGHIRIMARWEAHFQARLADHAKLRGDIDTARNALDRALQVLDGLEDRDVSEIGVRADLLAQRARLAEAEGDLDLAEDLHRQAIQAYQLSSPRLHATAVAELARLRAERGDATGSPEDS